MSIDTLIKSHDTAVYKATCKTAVKVVKEICKLLPLIHEVQPNITGVNTGMGTWSFNGTGIGVSTEDECKGEIITIDDSSIEDAIINNNEDWYSFKTNKALRSLPALLNYLVAEDLNCSTWQDGFDLKGIVFYHSETSNQSNPFSTPNKEYFTDNDYYKMLVKNNIPITFISAGKN